MLQNADGQILKGGTAFSKKRHKQLTQVWYEIPPLTTTVKCPNNFTVSFNLLHWSCSQTPGLWKMTWKFLFHSCKWAALVAMPNTISKEMEIHQRHGSEWRYHNIRRRLDHLCVIWLRDSYVACIEPSGCVWFYDFIFLSLSLSLQLPLRGESMVGRISFRRWVWRTWITFALSLGCVQAHWASTSLLVRQQMSGAPPVTRNYKYKQTKTREQHWHWVTPGALIW